MICEDVRSLTGACAFRIREEVVGTILDHRWRLTARLVGGGVGSRIEMFFCHARWPAGGAGRRVQLAHCPGGFEAFEHGVRVGVGQDSGAALPSEAVRVDVCAAGLLPSSVRISRSSLCMMLELAVSALLLQPPGLTFTLHDKRQLRRFVGGLHMPRSESGRR